MIGALGLSLTIVGAGSGLLGVLAAVRVSQGHWDRGAVRRAAWAAFASLTMANLLMVVALVSHDFSIAYVAEVGSRSTPLLFAVASLWASLEGSILFWAGLLSAVTLLFVTRTRGDDLERVALAGGVLLGLVAFFALIVAGPGNPWQPVSHVPLDGPGPNPLLQDHPLMAFHPPLMYLGFVGLAVPFAITVDALLRGRLDAGWLRVARRWTLGPWALLTLGLVAGMWWSYAVLGWGGYWGWDPVENVALLPWLTATAFLHSAMVGRRGGSLISWNVALIVASFTLTVFATLVTRSGILDSVHAFTKSAIGPLFVGLLGAILAGTTGLLLVRLPEANPEDRLGARGRAILLNNLALTAMAATVFLGTIFPLIAEAAGAGQLSVGAPYFERIVGPLGAGLLVLVGIGPTLPWGDWSSRARRSLVPGALSAAVASIAVAAVRPDAPAVAGTAAGAFALAQSAAQLVRRTARLDRSDVIARPRVKRSSARAIGGLVAHVGVSVLALAVLASSAGKRESIVSMRPGETATILGETVTYGGPEQSQSANQSVISAALTVGSEDPTALTPALSVFPTSAGAIATPAIVAGPTEDLYVTLLDVDPATGIAKLRVGIHPFASWIWPAGGLTALGGLLAAWPLVRVRRRAEARDEANVPLRRTHVASIDVVGD